MPDHNLPELKHTRTQTQIKIGSPAWRSKKGIASAGNIKILYIFEYKSDAINTTTATNCSPTRQRISFCDKLAFDPRTIFHKPIINTTNTAAAAKPVTPNIAPFILISWLYQIRSDRPA